MSAASFNAYYFNYTHTNRYYLLYFPCSLVRCSPPLDPVSHLLPGPRTVPSRVLPQDKRPLSRSPSSEPATYPTDEARTRHVVARSHQDLI
jgi:hypothetical protein